ncbi:LOW QUALITY PROTEIN: hypothetical protein TorRG33x02_247700 [Trema orientale]|uniref:Uncharacterized protein n=1 Tax=Trema orientale TaxID=63057 RepID=A0A2P5DLM3_TREOI|nr:LOW QUALITY PROTEIN: hypothetical protein TorRG33x02_247700 [Trema orientale]
MYAYIYMCASFSNITTIRPITLLVGLIKLQYYKNHKKLLTLYIKNPQKRKNDLVNKP